MNGRAEGGAKRTALRIVVSLVVTLLLLGGLAAAGAYLWSEYGERVSEALGWTSNDYEGSGHGETIVVISRGEFGDAVAATLADADVVKTSEAFYELLLQQDPEVEFLPGSYRLKLQMSAQAALDAIQDPENRMAYTAMIPEGKTVAETIEIIAASADIPIEELEAATADPSLYGLPAEAPSLEGWLFPATYEFEESTTGAEAIQRLVDEQKRVLDEFGVAEKDRERVLNIAAMVQREAGTHEDFGKVSAVIHNRLADDALLQMDSTAQYGMGQHADGSVWSTDEALSDDNAWNTYVHPGLPAGPIANPGRDAISAALTPAPGEWRYFVAVNLDTGESVFSNTLEEHEAAVAQLNEWCAANPGKGC